MILYYYACTIFFTVTVVSFPYDREYATNVGTVLFSASDIHRKQWSKSKIGLLQARRYFQNLLPPPILINTFNEGHVNILLGYFKDAYSSIKKEAKDPETDTIMTTALSDVIGGYLKVWVLPVAKLDYYGGTISQANVVKLFQFYNEIKRYLDTNGDGWRKPDEKILNSVTINVAPLQLFSNTRSMKDPCDHLAYFEKSPTGLSIPTPYVNWNDKSSTMFVPLKNGSLISMNTPDTSHSLIKYYNAARSCIKTSDPKQQGDFDKKFQKWLVEDVVPHLKDDNLYLALGSVLTLVNRTQDLCNNVLDLYAATLNPCKKPKISIPCDISSKKMWILTIILLIEIAWCVPALIFVLCFKKFKKKDCSSNVYLFIDNDKKDKDKRESNINYGENPCEACLENTPGGTQILRETVYSNIEFIGQCPSSEKTTTLGTGMVPCRKLSAKTCTSFETKTSEMCDASKKSSLKKNSSTQFCNSTQMMALRSHDALDSKQNEVCLTSSRLMERLSFVVDVPSKSKKRWGKKSNDCCKKPSECRQFEDSVKLEERRKAEECRKLQERKQAEECGKLEERRQANECKKLEERRQAKACRRLEERKQSEEGRQPVENKQSAECTKLEENKMFGEFRKSDASIKFDELRKLDELRQLDDPRKLDELRKLDKCRKHQDRKIRDECKKFEDRIKLEECRKFDENYTEVDECKKLEERRKLDECRKLEELRKQECKNLEELGKPDECKKLEELRKLNECRKLEEQQKVDKCKDVDQCSDVDNFFVFDGRREYEDYREFDENGKPNDYLLSGCLHADDFCELTEVKYDNMETRRDNVDDCNDHNASDEPMSCKQSVTQETPFEPICPCTECMKQSSIDSNLTYGMSLIDMQFPLDKQVDTKKGKSETFRVKKAIKIKEGNGDTNFFSGMPYLEIKIERPGTEICVDLSQCRTRSLPYKPSKIPKLACNITSGRECTCSSPVDKHKSLIPQLMRKPADDLDLASCHCSESAESKLNSSF